MGMEIGALLGSLDGSQSFEHIGSWDTGAGIQAFWILAPDSETHSSHLASAFRSVESDTVFSGEAYIEYNYTSSNDVFKRWDTTVNTHRLVSYFWGRAAGSGSGYPASSNDTVSYLNSEFLALTHTAFPGVRNKIETYATSSDIYRLRFTIVKKFKTHVLDDVTTAIDVLDLYPERDFKFKDEIFTGEHETLGGGNPSYKWGFNKKWSVPLKYLPEDQARLINQWWQDTTPLMFNADTSDDTQLFAVVLTNKDQPMTNVNKPYHYEWDGTLELSALSPGLVF